MGWDHAKTADLVGAGSGMGKAIALQLARRDFKMGIVDYGMDDARSTLDIIRANGRAELYYCDVRKIKEVQAMADHFFDVWGEVGLLVNNPRIDCDGDVEDVPAEKWVEVIKTNFLGVVHACHAFIPGMIIQGGGHIVNGTYGNGITSASERTPYSIASVLVIAYTERLRNKVALCDIGVTMLCPSLANTRLIDGWLQNAGIDAGTKELIRG